MTFLVEPNVQILHSGRILTSKQRTRDMFRGDIVVGGGI
jgi:hypothetical protein